MRILYLHGLESKLNDQKRAVLSQFGEVVSPDIDYRADNQIISSLYEQYKSEGMEVVIGSSMGGFAAYHLSLQFNTACLAFNPALPGRSVEQFIPEITTKRNKYLQVVLGSKDETVNPEANLDFLKKYVGSNVNSRIHLINLLGHQIPLEIFEQEVTIFFSVLTA